MPNTYKVITFDCDGVMFDTSEANRAYYNSVLAAFGKPPMTPQQFAFSHSHTVHASLQVLFDDPEERGRAEQYRRSMNYQPFVDAMRIEPHLKPLLGRLRPKYNTAVATNRTDSMPRVMQLFGLNDLFDLVVTAIDVPNPKPHPDMLLRILAHFDIHPDQMLYVGDSEVDQLAAEAAGVPLAAYNNPNLRAARHVQNLAQLADLLDG